MNQKQKEWEQYAIDLAKHQVDVLKYNRSLRGETSTEEAPEENPTPPRPPKPPM
jgi:hypothetical protein